MCGLKIEEGQIWREVQTGRLVRVRSIRWSDLGEEILVENVDDRLVGEVWAREHFIERCELMEK